MNDLRKCFCAIERITSGMKSNRLKLTEEKARNMAIWLRSHSLIKSAVHRYLYLVSIMAKRQLQNLKKGLIEAQVGLEGATLVVDGRC